MKLVDSTPELSRYAKQMWMRHEQSLAKSIQQEAKSKIGPTEAEAVARFVLDAFPSFAANTGPREDFELIV
jgi:hypothetical protein